MATLAPASARLEQQIPNVFSGMNALHHAALDEPGALDVKSRDLIGLAIGVTKQDDGCIAAYTLRAAQHGVTAEEVAAAIGVALLMNGGPAHVWGARAFAAYEDWTRSGAPAR
jgi:AhpD family alkylhydroperoxidase